MVVNANDFVFVGCDDHAENDTDAQGGGIDKNKLITMFGLEMSGPDVLNMECSQAITASFRVTGRDGAGTIITDDFTFTAETGPLQGDSGLTFHRVLKVEKLTGYSPTTIPSNAVIGFFEETSGLSVGYLYGSGRSPSGEEITEVRRLFIGATRPVWASPPTTKVMYEKFFILNGHPTDSMTAGYIKKTLDASGLCAFDLEDSLDGTESVANRVTIPTDIIGGFDSFDKQIQDAASPPIGTLAAGEAQGVWISLSVSHLTVAGVGQVNIMADGSGF